MLLLHCSKFGRITGHERWSWYLAFTAEGVCKANVEDNLLIVICNKRNLNMPGERPASAAENAVWSLLKNRSFSTPRALHAAWVHLGQACKAARPTPRAVPEPSTLWFYTHADQLLSQHGAPLCRCEGGIYSLEDRVNTVIRKRPKAHVNTRICTMGFSF